MHAVREKMFFLTTLLKETGDIATTEGRTEEGRACYLKGLHLLLDSLSRGDGFEQPEFVPKVELFVGALDEIPGHASVLLMEHYERIGQFGKAEDCLFAILEADPKNAAVQEFGISFYRRLLGFSDDALGGWQSCRAEVEASVPGRNHSRRNMLRKMLKVGTPNTTRHEVYLFEMCAVLR